jgi:uncharacterized Fe-S cluster-containing protein
LVLAGNATASIAPSFAALYSGPLLKRLPSALRQLGFRFVSETAEGAKYITEKSFVPDHNGCICTACPVVVNYVEKYQPDMLNMLIPVVSPMVAHGRLLKSRYNNTSVIFIGPCAAKKTEAMRSENRDAVDAVLTFEELKQWLIEEDISLDFCPESGFDNATDVGNARLFPIEGGMLATGSLSSEPSNRKALYVSGTDAVIQLFHDKTVMATTEYIEPLFCSGGCINGQVFSSEKLLFERRRDIIDYWQHTDEIENSERPEIPFIAKFTDKAVHFETVTEDQIAKVLEKTGKAVPEFQLNCGACGYTTCADNAIAIVRGISEPEMCLPYMHRLAQQRTDKIIETTPNGIVVLDYELNILSINSAFQKMFMCNNNILGRRISYLVNADGFELLQSGTEEKYESIQKKYDIRYHEILYALRQEEQYVGIYSDITKLKFDINQLDVIKTQTLRHAKEFLEHQINFSQEMAHFLGKSTAQSEKIAKQLIGLFEQDELGDNNDLYY